MKLVGAYFKAHLIEILRIPGLLVPMLIVPAMLYLFFGVRDSTDPFSAIEMMVGYAAFGVLGVAFFQFGVLIAEDRRSDWEVYLRSLPVSPLVRFAARLLAALVSELAVVILLFILSSLFTPIQLEPVGWLVLGASLIVCSIPFGLLGIALGYWVNPRSASAIANILWLLLAYASGVWGEPARLFLPIMPYLPTRMYIEAISSLAASQAGVFNLAAPWLGLLAYSVAGLLLALWGYRRDEGLRYS